MCGSSVLFWIDTCGMRSLDWKNPPHMINPKAKTGKPKLQSPSFPEGLCFI